MFFEHARYPMFFTSNLKKKKQLDHVLMKRDSAVGDPSSHTSETLVVIVRPKIARDNDTHMWDHVGMYVWKLTGAKRREIWGNDP